MGIYGMNRNAWVCGLFGRDARECVLNAIPLCEFVVFFFHKEEQGSVLSIIHHIFKTIIVFKAEMWFDIVFIPANGRDSMCAKEGDIEGPIRRLVVGGHASDGILDADGYASEFGEITFYKAAIADGVIGELIDDIQVEPIRTVAIRVLGDVGGIDDVAGVVGEIDGVAAVLGVSGHM